MGARSVGTPRVGVDELALRPGLLDRLRPSGRFKSEEVRFEDGVDAKRREGRWSMARTTPVLGRATVQC